MGRVSRSLRDASLMQLSGTEDIIRRALTSSRAIFILELVLLSLEAHLRLGWSTLLSATLFHLDNGNGLRLELNATVAAIGACMKLAMVVEVVLAVKLILAAELAAEAVGPFTVIARLLISILYQQDAGL